MLPARAMRSRAAPRRPAGRAFEAAARLTPEAGARGRRLLEATHAPFAWTARPMRRGRWRTRRCRRATNRALRPEHRDACTHHAQAIKVTRGPRKRSCWTRRRRSTSAEIQRQGGGVAAGTPRICGDDARRNAARGRAAAGERAWPAAEAARGALHLIATLVPRRAPSSCAGRQCFGGTALQAEALALLRPGAGFALSGNHVAPAGMTELARGTTTRGADCWLTGCALRALAGARTAVLPSLALAACVRLDFRTSATGRAAQGARRRVRCRLAAELRSAVSSRPSRSCLLATGCGAARAAVAHEARTTLADALAQAELHGVESTRTVGAWAWGHIDAGGGRPRSGGRGACEAVGAIQPRAGPGASPASLPWAPDLAEACGAPGGSRRPERTLEVLDAPGDTDGACGSPHAGVECAAACSAGDAEFEAALRAGARLARRRSDVRSSRARTRAVLRRAPAPRRAAASMRGRRCSGALEGFRRARRRAVDRAGRAASCAPPASASAPSRARRPARLS